MKKLLPFLLSLFTYWVSIAQLTIQIEQTPNNTPTNSSLFLAGNINNWAAGDSNYIFDQLSNGTYELVLNISAGNIEFKITRGSWPTVEGNAVGEYRPNRNYNYSGQTDTLRINVLSWEDLSGSSPGSTAAENVSILSENFDLAGLGEERRVWIYLPPDYEQSNKRYPVMYMHDGQNLFDDQTSFSGEWKVDETLNELFAQGDPGIIIVGIDNGGASRIDEYTPWPNPQYGGGNGATYISSIISDLKPYIDTYYRTYSDPENTGIMGSSLGGLISLYGLIEHQEVFGKAGIFSPSYWFSGEVFNHVLNTQKEKTLRVYSIGGEQEGGNMANNLQHMDSVFTVTGFTPSEFKTTLHPDGQHSETYWSREFGEAYLWLFRNNTSTSASNLDTAFTLAIYPNPTRDSFQLKLKELQRRTCLKITDLSGKVWLKNKVKALDQVFTINKLPTGMYQVQLYQKGRLVGSEKLIIY